MKLDAVDKKILNILQADGRITNAKLASEVGVSPPTMLERVKRLERMGVIRQYVALVDFDKVGKGALAIVAVSLALHQLSSLDRCKKEISQLEEVLECYHVSGEEDFALKVAVKNVKEYEAFVVNKLARIQGVTKIKTTFVLSTVKFNTKVFVDNQITE